MLVEHNLKDIKVVVVSRQQGVAVVVEDNQLEGNLEQQGSHLEEHSQPEDNLLMGRLEDKLGEHHLDKLKDILEEDKLVVIVVGGILEEDTITIAEDSQFKLR